MADPYYNSPFDAGYGAPITAGGTGFSAPVPQSGVASSTQDPTGGSATLTGGNQSSLFPTSPINLQTGSGWDILAATQAFSQHLAQINNAANAYLTQQNNAAAAARDSGQINANQYAAKQLQNQRESEFARTLAFQNLQEQHQNQYNQQKLGLDAATEARNERETQAKLAANPSDLVAYEFYKRALGTPVGQLATPPIGGIGTSTAPGAQGVTGSQSAQTAQPYNPAAPLQSNGQPYSAAPPAYNDPTLQTLGSSLFQGDSPNTYNPNLGGTGAFGINVAAPNQVSRGAYDSLSDTEKAMMDSIISGGITIGGKQVSVPTDDYHQQMQNSWVPTLDSVKGVVNYS